MLLSQVVFLAALLAALTAAFARGGRPERLGGALLLAAALVSPLVQTRNYHDVEFGIAVVDVLVLAALGWLAFAMPRRWPTYAVAFQALAVLTHVARFKAGTIDTDAYSDLQILWSYPVLGALAWGALVEAPQMGSRHGPAATIEPPAAPVRKPAPALANDEHSLLAQLLRAHGLGNDAAPIATALLARTGSFSAAIATTPARLRSWGMNEQVVDAFAFARGITRSALRRKLETRANLADSEAAVDYLHSELADLGEEQFRILYLNSRHRLIHDEVHAQGTVTAAAVFPREVVRRAIEVGAVHLILAHNHPGGDPTPSRADVATTRAIMEAARAIDVSVVDHLIISRTGHVSMRAAGLI